ncbi:FxSxx-COOH system tetratricopeptide repeat protein [Streptomyces justiciae]|uniref:FxSxx-COOH system tetratricopeptide repeat protein n=1 Tax=Streptomyces justiciae TaxID=2780140 RepID=UPI002117C889|nr:FxSxx-COOH system tetratricopeptide repeat protein [Streptomyces justiciae]MCW8381517.1 FxSxx-COOH system tetratricopeptide repeat protein [Streptomyces justiciae]
MTVRATDKDAGPQHFLVSYVGYDRTWAGWLGHRLEEHGHRVTLRPLDPQASATLTDALADLGRASGKVIMVLSDRYFGRGGHTTQQWNEALAAVTEREPGRYVGVTLTSGTTPGAAAALEPVELWGIDAREAEYRVLRRLGLPVERLGVSTGRHGPRFPNDPPEVWGGVPRRNPRFTGRIEVMNRLRERLQEAPSGAKVVTLLGMSGVGKTQIATEYTYRYASEYDVVWWVPAQDRASMRERLAELAPAFQLGVEAASYGERIRTALEALRRGRPYGRWLIVFDGCDEPDILTDLLPSGAGDVIITSRNRDWATRNTQLVEVPVYTRRESVIFIRRRALRLRAEEAEQLAEALGDFPLALDQTAGWLADSPMTVPAYLDLLKQRLDAPDVLRVSEEFPTPFPQSIAILLNSIREEFPDARALLRLCVFFAPGRVPLRLLRQIPATDLPEEYSGLMNDQVRWNAALNKLVQFSVAGLEYSEHSAEAGGSVETVQLHSMVYGVVRQDVAADETTVLSRAVRRVLAKADPGGPAEPRNWARYAELIPHLEPSGALASSNPEIQNFVLQCLRFLNYSGEYRTCLALCEQADQQWRDKLGDHHAQVRELGYTFGAVLRMLGQFRRAEALSRRMVDQLSEERGDRDLETLRAMSLLGSVLLRMAKYDTARELFEHGWTTYRSLLGEDDASALDAQNNLAVALRLLGRYREAYELDLDTLRRRERVMRTRHLNTLSSGISCARGLRLMGRYTEALSHQEQSLRLNRALLGENHPLTLLAEHNLALCQRRGGDLNRAGDGLRDVYERSRRVFGADYPATLMIASDLAAYLREYGNLDESGRLTEDVVSAYLRQLGPAHPYYLGELSNLGLVLRAQGAREEAHNLCEQALVGMDNALGSRHPWTLGAAMNAAAGRNFTRRLDEAFALSTATYDGCRAVLGDHHPMTLSAQVALAYDLRDVGRPDEADPLEQDALRRLAETLGPQHIHTVSARERVRPYWEFEPQPA